MKCTNCTHLQLLLYPPTHPNRLLLQVPQYQKQIPNENLSIHFFLHLKPCQLSFLSFNWNRRLLVLISIAQLNKPGLGLQMETLIFMYNFIYKSLWYKHITSVTITVPINPTPPNIWENNVPVIVFLPNVE